MLLPLCNPWRSHNPSRDMSRRPFGKFETSLLRHLNYSASLLEFWQFSQNPWFFVALANCVTNVTGRHLKVWFSFSLFKLNARTEN